MAFFRRPVGACIGRQYKGARLAFISRSIQVARVIRGTRSASASKISRSLSINHGEAVQILARFAALHIVTEANEAGFRTVKPSLAARALLFVIALGGRTIPVRAAPAWETFNSYHELSRYAARCYWITPEAFVEGPFARFLALASEPELPSRARARILECARMATLRHSAALPKRGDAVASFDKAIAAKSAVAFENIADRNYLLAVLDGRANHNRLE